jgi:hypothetical protein
MVSLRRRFRSLVEFHIGSYIFYRKHIQRSPWSPTQIIIVVGIIARFLLSLAAQALVELRGMLIAFGGKPAAKSSQKPTGNGEGCASWPGPPLSAPVAKPRRDC